MLDRIGLIQIDSVNVLVRSQELPLFARLGPHPRTLIADATAAGELFEYWVHEAEPRPDRRTTTSTAGRCASRTGGRRSGGSMADRADYIEEVYDYVVANGPVVAGDLKQRVGKKGTWWDCDDGKIALEALFYDGPASRLAGGRSDFARVYDLTERMHPGRRAGAAGAARARGAQGAARARRQVPRRRHVRATSPTTTGRRKPPCRPLARRARRGGPPGRRSTVEGWEQPAYVHPDAVRAAPDRRRGRC